jgi:hypothetical protein
LFLPRNPRRNDACCPIASMRMHKLETTQAIGRAMAYMEMSGWELTMPNNDRTTRATPRTDSTCKAAETLPPINASYVVDLLTGLAAAQGRSGSSLHSMGSETFPTPPCPLPTPTQEQNVAVVTYHVKLGFNKRSKFNLDDELYDEQNLPSGRDYEQSRSGSRPRWSAASPTCPVRTLSCGANDCESMAPKIPARQHRPHG